MVILNDIKAILAETQLSYNFFAETLEKDLTTISKWCTNAKFTSLHSEGIASLNLGNLTRYITQKKLLLSKEILKVHKLQIHGSILLD
jgi:hypothetical protein